MGWNHEMYGMDQARDHMITRAEEERRRILAPKRKWYSLVRISKGVMNTVCSFTIMVVLALYMPVIIGYRSWRDDEGLLDLLRSL